MYAIMCGGPIVFGTKNKENIGLIPEVVLDDIDTVKPDICFIFPYMVNTKKIFLIIIIIIIIIYLYMNKNYIYLIICIYKFKYSYNYKFFFFFLKKKNL